ncbi:diguanylate cyclase/phosphodiesterase (GGDEF & EAL domains) with PAS/PAC sensor(s) [Methylorubrum populi]|uniref:Diguanylate cyclase/phosphodiesterase (GGDEF & EAL domains) with PAS/PAC sensor(S) n=1 Tax=Methylorubrum populi TaxID=223967 RepID=A0A833J7L3_9HYPH|nr:diguanylate cyclase/phosphodiesterase (GGDEF & EAL domains) with PAS/PAC sensor(s) [Methylorubrum populi]
MFISFPVGTHRESEALDNNLRARVRVEQFDVALRLVPFTVLVSLSVVQVIVYLFWNPDNRAYLGLLEAAILPLAIAVLQQCWQWRSRPKPRELTGTFIRRAVLAAYAYGCLLASIPIMLFVGADPDGRLLIAASCAGLIATGMSAAVLPPVAIGFSGLIIAGSFFGLAATGERFYIYVATLLVFYAAFICFTILHLSRLLKMRVVSQIDLERQQEFTNLLLNEFEENASDWLWETNAELRLQHVSPRLVEVARSSERQLLGLPLEQLLLPAVAAPDGHPSTVLWNCIAERRTFRNLILPLNIAGEQRTWELSGKPIFTNGTRFSGYRGVGSDVTEKRQSEERLSYLALHDTLTDLPNRVQFQQLLEAAREQGGASGRFAVLALDLDEFKNVNDTFGHAAGDGLLRAFAERLQRFASSDVHIARLAGDEFALLAKGSAARDRHTVALLASDIVAAVASPFTVNGIRVSIGVSIGIAMAPQDGCLEIMRRADLALYRTKGEGRNGYRFYEAEMDERIEARRALSTDLRGALDRNEFLLHFQPIVSREGRVRGFEALVRWKHPKRGFVSPAEFIPLAEETGVIIPLGEWILQQACATAAGWPGDISIAVNLSPIQFRHSDLPLLVISALQESGLDASRLEIEITESVFLEATPAIKTALAKLRELGVRLSLDDFGTGYSSLSYLRRLAFDKIKIDQSFVRDLPQEQSGAAIVRAIIDLATSLKMTVIAEGVETEAQRRCLLSLGCHALQGYLFSRPVPADEADALVTGQGLRRQTIHAA